MGRRAVRRVLRRIGSAADMAPQDFHFGSAGVTAGGRRIFVDCSKSYAALNRVPSEKGTPRNSNPSGRPSLEKPPGTASAGKPRIGANWRLVPKVVCGNFVGA